MSDRLPTITLKCKHCGYCVKRAPNNPCTGHKFNPGFSYICPDCNASLDVVDEQLPEDVRTTDPVTVLKAKEDATIVPVPPWKVDYGETMERNFERMVETLKKISANRPDDIHHLEFQLAVNNAKWELIKAKAALKKLKHEVYK